MLEEFKEFIKKGDVVTIAVGLVMALFFAQIVNAVLEGIIMPIIAAIFGEPDIVQIDFTINEAVFSIGAVINAIIVFLAVAFILFLVVKAYNRYIKTPEEEAAPTEVELLTQIRDSLQNR